MRTITLLIIHCSATPEGKDYTVEDIDRWHKARGFNCQGIHIGYHYVVYRDGSIHTGRPESMFGAHCKDHNTHSIGICYIGGLKASPQPSPEGKGVKYVPADTRTLAQKAALLKLLTELKKKYPRALIMGHNVFANKSCPCYDAAKEYQHLQPK